MKQICRNCKHGMWHWDITGDIVSFGGDCFIPELDKATFDFVNGAWKRTYKRCIERNYDGKCQWYVERRITRRVLKWVSQFWS